MDSFIEGIIELLTNTNHTEQILLLDLVSCLYLTWGDIIEKGGNTFLKVIQGVSCCQNLIIYLKDNNYDNAGTSNFHISNYD